jgi:hypothetical protein
VAEVRDPAVAVALVEGDRVGLLGAGLQFQHRPAAASRLRLEGCEHGAGHPGAPLLRHHVHALHLAHLGPQLTQRTAADRNAVRVAGEQEHGGIGGRRRRARLAVRGAVTGGELDALGAAQRGGIRMIERNGRDAEIRTHALDATTRAPAIGHTQRSVLAHELQ